MSFLANRPLVFVDTETTGLDPHKNCLIEVSAVKFHQKNLTKLGEFTSLLKPSEGAIIQPEAMQVNKIASEDLESAPPAKEVLQKFLEFIKGSIMVGHNLRFDLGFLEVACFKNDLDLKKYMTVYHTLDTCTLAWPLYVTGKINSLSLKNLCDHFNISNEGSHRANQDVMRTFELYKRLVGHEAAGIEGTA